MKTKLHFLFPALLVAALLAVFGWSAWSYTYYQDDYFFIWGVSQADGSVLSLTRDLFEFTNGRLFSHFVMAATFTVLERAPWFSVVYHFLLLAAFVPALAVLVRSFLSTFRNVALSFRSALGWSAFITAFFFFFYFEEKQETWFWISATGVHLLSLILAMCGLAAVLGRGKIDGRSGLAFLLFFLAGGTSESYALMYGLLLAAVMLAAVQLKLFAQGVLSTAVAGILGLAGGLALNLFSGGISNRLGQLPDFHLLQALKNTAHSLAFPFLRYEYLGVKIALIALLVLFAKQQFGQLHFEWKSFFRRGLYVMGFITISFFIPCYLLSDIVPARAASLGYLAGVLFLFDQLIFKKLRN